MHRASQDRDGAKRSKVGGRWCFCLLLVCKLDVVKEQRSGENNKILYRKCFSFRRRQCFQDSKAQRLRALKHFYKPWDKSAFQKTLLCITKQNDKSQKQNVHFRKQILPRPLPSSLPVQSKSLCVGERVWLPSFGKKKREKTVFWVWHLQATVRYPPLSQISADFLLKMCV